MEPARRFAGVDPHRGPDETTIGQFRPRWPKPNLTPPLLALRTAHRTRKGRILKQGSIGRPHYPCPFLHPEQRAAAGSGEDFNEEGPHVAFWPEGTRGYGYAGVGPDFGGLAVIEI